MNEQTVFDASEEQPPQQTSQAGDDAANHSYYSQLVGEGKKYSDNESLAKGTHHAQDHIGNLESQVKELREELGKRESAEEVARNIREELKTGETNADPATSGLSADEVAEIVRNTVTGLEAGKTASANMKEADRHFKSVHGERSQEIFDTKARELGLSSKQLLEVAQKSPTAFANMVGLSQQTKPAPRSDAPIKGSVNTEALNVNNSGQPKEGSKAYYTALRKELGQKFWEPEIQKGLWAAKKDGRYDA